MQLRSKGSAALAVLGMAVALSGCGNPDLDVSQPWFTKPVDVFGKKGGYTFSELQDARQRQRPITTNDLVNSNGTCPLPVAQASVPQAAVAQAPGAPGAPAATASPDTASLLGSGIALGMAECDVVFRAGQPTSVQLGTNPNGDRTAVLTYNSGPRPGVYRFEFTPQGPAGDKSGGRVESQSVAFNVDTAAEGDLRRASRDDIESAAPGALLHSPGSGLADLLRERKSDLSESPWLYLFILLVLVAEQAMAVRLSNHMSGAEANTAINLGTRTVS